MKKNTVRVLTAALAVLVVVGLFFVFYIQSAHQQFASDITLEANGTTQETMTVESLNLKPGENVEYTVNLKCKATGKYLVALNFNQTDNQGLESFVMVEIECGSRKVTKSLATLFGGDEITQFECDLDAETPTGMTIRYSMPLEVGNEAQGTGSVFDIVLTATHES